MKIVDLRATPVTVPAEAPWRWSMGIETGTTRTIVELITDDEFFAALAAVPPRHPRNGTPAAPTRRVLHRL